MQMVSTKVEEQPSGELEYDSRPRIYLDDDLVEKLGLKGIPAPGTVFAMKALAVAERVTAEAEEGGEPDVSLCLILTEVGLTPTKVSDSERAKSLYGSEE